MKNTYLNFKVGDYAIYIGDLSKKSKILRESSKGTIESFEDFNGKKRVLFKPLDSEQSIWTDFENLREIESKWKHLEALGFNKIEVGKDNFKYFLDGITISGIILMFVNQNGSQVSFITRWCIADFEKFDSSRLEFCLNNGYFDKELFFEKYPSVFNLNRLFEELEIRGINLNKKIIMQL